MKIWIISKKTGIICVVVLMVLLCLLCVGRNQAITVSKPQRDLPIYCVDKGDEKVLSISFDAAWGADDTMNLIDILGKYDVKATFFVVGSWVDEFPDAVKALSDAGHEIMNHSNSHPHMTQISKEKMKEEVETCNQKIEAITGRKPNLFRAPYGDYNNDVVQAVRECGSYTIQWDVDSLDWKNLSAQEITKRVTEKVKPGSIVLFHNAALHTPEALPGIIEKIQSDGYKFVPISELIYTENYQIDQTGKQCQIAGEESPQEGTL
ncbi:MAG: polysaccharide deacetylase family protein [Clostridia bacterium]|nr:polysaccharide deacetylase family protein [Clostridia bacterium]